MRAVRQALFLGSALILAACGGGEVEPAVQSESLGSSSAPLHQVEPSLRIDGAYIVKVKEGASARAVAALAGVSPRHEYSIINGFAAELNPGQLTALRQNPDVEYVEEDALVEPYTTQSSAPWGLDRIDQHGLPLSGTYTYTGTGSCANAYIIDTGIQTSHPQFGGRAVVAYDALGGNGQDCNGHGTHVAGIVGGSTYGVAKGVRLRAVRVMDCNGSGTNSGVIAGIDWVRLNHVKPAVANISLGGPFSSTVNTAVTNLSNSGVFVAVAAGNSGSDACNYSPASATAVTTVGAAASNDTRATFSNHGTCVDIYAPGASIPSSGLNGTTTTLSGSSMAAAHVTGLAALYKCTYGDAAQVTIDAWIKNNGTPLPFGKLLYKGAL